ncbi:MAG: SURF1 family protein [Gemmatimonadales bacterium]
MSTFVDTQMSSGRKSLLLLTIIVAAGCAGLGFWQLSRLADRQERNALSLAQRDLPTVDLTQAQLPEPVSYRRVTLSGSYDFEKELVIRGRLLRGAPGVQVVTPLRLAGSDTAVLVNRGFVPTPDAGYPTTTEGYREAAGTNIMGIALAIPDDGDGAALDTPKGETWRRLDLTALRARYPYPIASYYVVVEADTLKTRDHTLRGRVLPIRIEPPELDDGPHFSYAMQWFMIGGAALGFGIVFIRRRRVHSPVPD